MKDRDYEIMRELIEAREVFEYLDNKPEKYSWENDILDTVTMRLMDLEDSFIADIKKR